MFSTTSRMVAKRYQHRGVNVPDGKVLVAGGAILAELSDPSTGAFSSSGSMDIQRLECTAT